MTNNNAWLWAAAAFGSGLAALGTAYYLGTEVERTKITFLVPFILIGAIGTIKILGEER